MSSEEHPTGGRTSRHWLMVALSIGLALAVALSMALADDAEAKKKKKKKKIVTVTQTFSGGALTIPSAGNATPYPSQVNVGINKLKSGVLDLNVNLNGYSHTFPDDVDVMLAGQGGQCVILMSDVGGGTDANNLNLTLDDQAAASLPDAGPLASGAFKPTNIGGGDAFPAPAPNPATCSSSLSVFNGTNPNGVYKLFVVDDLGGFAGSISSWSLDVTANVQKKR